MLLGAGISHWLIVSAMSTIEKKSRARVEKEGADAQIGGHAHKKLMAE
jgi:hypothetical protein